MCAVFLFSAASLPTVTTVAPRALLLVSLAFAAINLSLRCPGICWSNRGRGGQECDKTRSPIQYPALYDRKEKGDDASRPKGDRARSVRPAVWKLNNVVVCGVPTILTRWKEESPKQARTLHVGFTTEENTRAGTSWRMVAIVNVVLCASLHKTGMYVDYVPIVFSYSTKTVKANDVFFASKFIRTYVQTTHTFRRKKDETSKRVSTNRRKKRKKTPFARS